MALISTLHRLTMLTIKHEEKGRTFTFSAGTEKLFTILPKLPVKPALRGIISQLAEIIERQKQNAEDEKRKPSMLNKKHN